MVAEPIRHDTTCRLCGSKKISTVLHLTPTPPEDQFVSKEKLHVSQDVYPLDLALCEACGYLHLPYVLSPEMSYTDYTYMTKVTLGLKNHYQEYADEILAMIKPLNDSLVVDLGSNDGSMLEAFKKRGMKVVGVEPAQAIGKAANDEGIPTIVEFFADSVTEQIIQKHGKARIITANYVYANVDNVVDFTRNVKRLLDNKGMFVIQTGYHPQQMKINMFDYIYHEHFSYFSVKVLKQLLGQCGMNLIHVSLHPAKGGSIRAIAQHRNKKQDLGESVESFIREEENARVHDAETYIRFENEIGKHKKKLLELIGQIKSAGHAIVGYGASHSTTTLLHHFELGKYLEYIVDDNSTKHGLYSPGYHLPVYPSRKLYKDRPEYVLVLAWQHRDSIIKRNMKYLNEGGKFIVPLPTLKVVS